MRLLQVFFLSSALALSAAGRARNVILFIGDAGGIPALHAASIHGFREPGKLFVQNMPHMGLMDTSAAGEWVTDSAAAMTAIVTGRKTDNGVLSRSAAVAGKERVPFKTILEYAEERGLSTGLISNSAIFDATPAACYAHVDRRSQTFEIADQALRPRFGNGPEMFIGADRKAVLAAAAKQGIEIESRFREKGYAVYDTFSAIPPGAARIFALLDGDYDLAAAVEQAVATLSKSRKGFFLMVEWDMHTLNLRRGLDRALVLDGVVRRTAERARKDTLIIFAADHSYDIRVRAGRKDAPLLPDPAAPAPRRPNVRVEDAHTGEQVLVAAQGPGSERVRGFFPNTELFRIMMAAYGWKPSSVTEQSTETR
jgi:alkaline phosphatase